MRILALTPLLLLTACAGPLNTESCVGVGLKTDSTDKTFCPPTVTQSAMREVPEEAAATVNQKLAPVYASGVVVQADDAKPSIVSLDRSNWGVTDLPVPNDLSAHQPRYTKNVFFNDTLRRTRGEYPTATSALDTGTGEGMDDQIKEAFVAPLAGAADVALFLPRVAVEARPNRPTRTGLEPYQRQPRIQTIVPAPLTFVTDDPTRPVAPMTPAPGVTAPPGSPEGSPSGQQAPPPAQTPANQPPSSSQTPPTATPPGPESSRPPQRQAPWERNTVRPGTPNPRRQD